MVAGASVIRWTADGLLNDHFPFGTYVGAVVFATWYGGIRGGIAAITVSALIGDYFFVEPRRTFFIRDADGGAAVLMFIAVSAVMSSQVAWWKRSDSRRRESEARLRERAAEMQAILDAVPAVVLLTRDASGNEIVGNRFCQERLGIASGQNVSHRLAPLDRPSSFEIARDGKPVPVGELPLQRVLDSGAEVRDVDLDIALRDGSGLTLFGNAVPLRDDAGRVQGAVAAFVDVTEQKRSQAALNRERLFLRHILDASPSIVIVKDEAGRVVLANEAAARFHGVPAAEMIGKTNQDFEFLVRSGQAKELDAGNAEALTSDAPSCASISLLSADGFHHDLQVTRVRLDEPIGSGYLLIVSEDVTEHRLAERALKQSSEAKAALEAQFRQSQKMEAVGRLAGGVAHDFNNLLTVILGYTNLLESSLSERDPRRRDAEEIRKAGESAASLTRQLLAFSRKQIVQPRPVLLSAVVSKMENMLRRVIGEDVQCTIVLPPRPEPEVICDGGQIEQVLMNLAVNARDAMPAGGELRIEVAAVKAGPSRPAQRLSMPPGRYVQLLVSDSGCGMSEEVKSHVFEPFFTTKEHGKGTGLGLATVYGIVKQHDGFIDFETRPGDGTTWSIFFPVRKAGEATLRPETPQADLPEVAARVLVVDDDDGVRRLTRRMLEEQGFEVFDAQSGERALRMIAELVRPIDVLLADVVMTGMNGPTLYATMRQSWPNLRVLLMSGYTGEALGANGVVDPDTPLIIKPYNVERLSAKIREVLSSPPWMGYQSPAEASAARSE